MPPEGTEQTQVIHTTVNGKYRVVFERSAVKGIDGFKVEANGDDYAQTMNDAQSLYNEANRFTAPVMKELE